MNLGNAKTQIDSIWTIVRLLIAASGLLGAHVATADTPATLPILVPAPVSIEAGGGAVTLTRSVVIVTGAGASRNVIALVRQILAAAGVHRVTIAKLVRADDERMHVVLGVGATGVVQAALSRSNATIPNKPEGYTIDAATNDGAGVITLAGHNADGLFHAVQTFRQLLARGSIPAMVLRDYPAMPIRGTIEGFYGKPWSMVDRIRHFDFMATIKANTYVYSPKDDPYARDRWRDAYPAALLRELGTLAAAARRNHIDVVYAISPGPSVCFSDPADTRRLERKFDALRGIGITNFYVALDDIEYAKWNCDRDRATFGPSGPAAAGVAQARFLNGVQASLASRQPAVRPLIMVPTEYYDAKDSPYKAALRKELEPRIVIQWTGTDVVPPAISIADAKAATRAFGRATLLWDNYPVNDYAQAAGRLLLAPYARREAGLTGELTGILSNPMNQEVPSRVAVAGAAAFAWNDTGYDAERIWIATARLLARGDDRTANALLTFFDTQHLAPGFGSQPWQQQAPRLKMLLDQVRDAIANGDAAQRHRSITDLIARADALANAPGIIRAGPVDPGFAAQAAPWLDAMQQWGKALQLTAAGLRAADRGSLDIARGYFNDAGARAHEASAIRSIPGATRFDGPIKLADGVLDRFIADAPTLFVTSPPPHRPAPTDDARDR